MNVKFSAVLSSLRGVLRKEVMPDLSSDHALTQTAAVMDVLEKISRLADWSSDLLRDKIERLSSGSADFRQKATALKLTPPAAPNIPALTSMDDLDNAVSLLNRDIVALTDWLFDHCGDLSADDRRDLQMTLRNTIQAAQAEERKLTAFSDFTATA